MAFFSVIIPTYKRAHSIRKAIESILSQTFQDLEVIIVDDASPDETEIIVNSIGDQRIKYIKNETNQERCVSRNLGIEEAIGTYICFLDSDDYHLPNHLQDLYDLIQSKQAPVAFFFTNAWDETEDGLRTERLCPDFQFHSRSHSEFVYFLKYTVNPQRWCVHRSIFEKIQFDPEVIICEDMDTSLRIVNLGYPVYQLNERTTVYVAAADSFTHGDTQKWEKELSYLKRIFAKKELKGKLPLTERNRLLSMCYFHLSNKQIILKNRWLTIKYAIKSFLMYPKGYNGKTNKIVLVNCLYSILKR
jgi:glycosyltransferase involved in cell wall biosynthesis